MFADIRRRLRIPSLPWISGNSSAPESGSKRRLMVEIR
jgi:hypothetical protein